MPVNPELYGLLAEFDSAGSLIEAARRVHAAGYTRVDAFTPYPLKGAVEALGMHRTAVPTIMFVGGLVGCVGAFFMQYWTAVVDYPVNVGGRPLNSWPAFIPVTFELTILTSALVGVFGLLALCGLPLLYHPVFNVPRFVRASRDGFFLCIEVDDPQFDPDTTRAFLAGLGAREVVEVPR
jgi:hypothetical protein